MLVVYLMRGNAKRLTVFSVKIIKVVLPNILDVSTECQQFFLESILQ